MRRWFPTVLRTASLDFTEPGFCASPSARAARPNAPKTRQVAANNLDNPLGVNMGDLPLATAQNHSEAHRRDFAHHIETGVAFATPLDLSPHQPDASAR